MIPWIGILLALVAGIALIHFVRRGALHWVGWVLAFGAIGYLLYGLLRGHRMTRSGG